MTIEVCKPSARAESSGGLAVWVDRELPSNTDAYKRDRLYCDLTPSRRLMAAFAAGGCSADEFVAAYELELDLVPAGRFALLVQSARRHTLTLVSERPIVAHTLRRYLRDLVAMTPADEEYVMSVSRQYAAVAERAYAAERASGVSHAAAVCATKLALRTLR